jgi:hydrogen cyanide synthase HcnC
MNRPTADVIVVGAGVIGCAVAYELARQSVSVLLIDQALPGRATSASAGGLWPVGEAVGLGCGVIYHAAQLAADPHATCEIGLLPIAFRDFLVQSNSRFPSLAGELRETTGIDIEYVPGAGLLFLMYQESERAFVRRVQQSLGASARVELLTPEEARRLEPNLTGDTLGAAFLPGEHQVNPMLLAEAYKRAAIRHGARFRHETRVSRLVRAGERVTGVEIGDATLSAGVVVNAAGAWAGELAATAGLRVPVEPIRGQIVLTQSLPPTLRGCLSSSGCYLAQKAHGEVLIGSTTERAGFDVSVTAEAITNLCRAAVRAVPLLERAGIKRVWAGLRPGTPDELPILGPMAGIEGYVNATGGFRTGIVAAPLTARLVAQAVTGAASEFPIGPFLADRFQDTA